MSRRRLPETCWPLLLLAVAAASCAPATVGVDPPPVPPAPPVAERAAPPPPMEMRPLEFPGFHESALPNGLGLVVVEYGTQPVANVALFVRSGSAADPAGKAGLATLLAATLPKGTESRSALEIAEAIEGVGGRLGAFAADDYTSVSATVLARDLPLAFDLLADVALAPTFPEEEVATERQRLLSALQVELGQPQAIARRAFMERIYGEHPYGVLSRPETVREIGRDDLAAFHRAHFSPGNAFLVVSGRVEVAAVEELARKRFGAWDGPPAPAPELPEPPPREEAQVYLVHRPGAAQSVLHVGHVALRPDDPDFPAAVVANRILGGGSDARLFEILREQMGLTYGAYSSVRRVRDQGHFQATADVRTEVTGEALDELLRQIRRMREEPVPQEELEAAKGFLVGSFPLSIQTPGQVAGQIADRRILGLPIEDLLTYRERIAAVTVEDVQRVAQRLFRPAQAAIVVAGDATRVLAEMEPVAPVTLLDVEGRPLGREALAAPAAAPGWDGTRLEAATLVYDLVVQGSPMGTVTSTLASDGEDWVSTMSVESPFMGQEAEYRFRRQDLAPVSVRSTISQGGVEMGSDLAYEGGHMRGRLELPPAAGGARDVDQEVPPGTLFSGMEAWALAAAELASEATLALPLFDGTQGEVLHLSARVVGAEEATVAAGTFPVYRVELTGGPQPTTLLLRQEPPHVLIKQEHAAMPVTIELRELR